jgi:hypothetical protein
MDNQIMKVNRSVIAAAFVVLLVSLSIHSHVTAQISSGEEEILKLFSSYQSSDGLRYIAYSHACREPLNKHRLIFYSSWFLEGKPRVAIQTRISEQGAVELVRSVFNWADQDGRSKQLTEGTGGFCCDDNCRIAGKRTINAACVSLPRKFQEERRMDDENL